MGMYNDVSKTHLILSPQFVDMGTQEKNLVFTQKQVFGDWFDCQWFFYFDPNNRRVPQYQKDR